MGRRRAWIVVAVAVSTAVVVALAALALRASCAGPPRPAEEAPRLAPRRAPAPSAQIRLSSDPAGARIWLGGEDLGRLTPDLFEVEPGRPLRVRLELEGRWPAEAELVLEPGEVREVHLRLAER